MKKPDASPKKPLDLQDTTTAAKVARDLMESLPPEITEALQASGEQRRTSGANNSNP